ncbi:MAG: NAD(P)H-dependent oxidoreductase [Oceanicaulis sp.]|jgi:FMN-dependent NADH-azoreductase|nr:NAD(P)H-dependent oxidoreductase [Oceanicaulis sp.]
MTAPRILTLYSSGRTTQSASRELADLLSITLAGETGVITTRDLVAQPLPFVDEAFVDASFTPPANRTAAQVKALAVSTDVLDELMAADQLVIAAPMYNYSIPAALKAWVDMVARANESFRYVFDDGDPYVQGLVKVRTVWLVTPTGGTPLESDMDFATGYLKYVLGFMGMKDVRVIDAAGWRDLDDVLKAAKRDEIRALSAQA